MMRQEGFDVNYVDDFVGIGVPSVAHHSYGHLRQLLQRLGLDVSVEKLVAPCTKGLCLGIDINTVAKTIAIPEDKMRCIEDMLNDLQLKHFASQQQLQSLLGNLFNIHKCIKPAHIFVNHMLQLLRESYDKNTITMTPDFRRNVRCL